MFQVEPHATDLQFRSMPSSIARCFAYTSLFRTFLGLKWALDQYARPGVDRQGRTCVFFGARTTSRGRCSSRQFRSMPSSIARCFAYTSLFRTFLGLKWALDQCARPGVDRQGRTCVCLAHEQRQEADVRLVLWMPLASQRRTLSGKRAHVRPWRSTPVLRIDQAPISNPKTS